MPWAIAPVTAEDMHKSNPYRLESKDLKQAAIDTFDRVFEFNHHRGELKVMLILMHPLLFEQAVDKGQPIFCRDHTAFMFTRVSGWHAESLSIQTGEQN
jgi:hypothetical protein